MSFFYKLRQISIVAMCARIDYCNWSLQSFRRSHITNQHACSTPGAIIFPPFLHLRVDGRKRFKYATCGREFFQKRRKKPPFSKTSGYVWTRPKSVLGYHHIPDHIQNMINSLYTNFKTSIITSNFSIPFI